MSEVLLRWLARCVVAAYLDDCTERGLAAKTIDWYGWHLERCWLWLEAEPEFHALDLVRAAGMAAYFRSTRDLARNTRRHMVAALFAFGSWLAGYGLANPARDLQKPRRGRRLPESLSPQELDRLLRALEEEPLRERAFVYLALDSGLRVGELATLERSDVDLQAGSVRVREGKGGKDRVVFVGPTTVGLVAEYLGSHDKLRVFVSVQYGHEREPMSANGLRQMMRRLAKRHGFERLNPHLLRHTAATELVAAGVDLSTVADQLGHADVSTTRIYAQLADERRREVVQRASPIERHVPGRIAAPGWPRREE